METHTFVPPTTMFTLAHPDAVVTSSEGRSTGRVDRYRGLEWWTSQKSRRAVAPESVEEESRSLRPVRLGALRAEAGKC